MAARALLHLGDPSNRCFFTTVQCYRTKIQPQTTPRHVRNFRKLRDSSKQVETPFPNVYVESGPMQPQKLWKPFGFSIAFSGATIVGAAIWEYERIRAHTYRVINQHQTYHRVRRTGWRGEMENWWRSLTEGQKIFVPICFLNVLVFLAWRVPKLQNTMVRYFCANPASSAMCWPMVLSTFSHYSLLHLAANMYVLHSFSSAAVASLGREQFLAVYMTSGVMSSLVSHLYKTAFSLPGLSLGASGAIMGVLGFVCTQYPDTKLNIIFLPMYTFTAGVAIKAIMGLDALGCTLGWRYFDHAAHLGGALWGIFWQYWGNSNIWQKREPVLTFWHSVRDPPRSH